jgi:hypothetical protein
VKEASMSDRDLRLSHGFDAGNYCSSYETVDYTKAVAMRDLKGSGKPYATAFILGFFASYELHEIPAIHRDKYVEAYQSEYGQRVLELGYIDPREEIDVPNEPTQP